jgi:hypothetical protein
MVNHLAGKADIVYKDRGASLPPPQIANPPIEGMPMKPILIALLAGWGLSAQAGDPASAQGLYQQHCTQCHQGEVMTRPERKVRNLQALQAQVRRCDANLGLKWFDEEINAMSNYLNEAFYHFKAGE